MTLIDTERAEPLYAAMGPAVEISGGSAANTIVGRRVVRRRAPRSSAGSRDDELGDGVRPRPPRRWACEFDAPRPRRAAQPTGRCLIVVTPDAAAHHEHLPRRVGAARPDRRRRRARRATRRCSYLEGYLWDEPDGQGGVSASPPRTAHDARPPGRAHAVRLRSASIVTATSSSTWSSPTSTCCSPTRPRSRSLYEVDDVRRRAATACRGHCEIAALTRSAQGSVVVAARRGARGRRRTRCRAVVDTTGAGDQYAAGFLYGLTHGYDLGTSRHASASLAAAEVIRHLGARPEVSLARARARLARSTSPDRHSRAMQAPPLPHRRRRRSTPQIAALVDDVGADPATPTSSSSWSSSALRLAARPRRPRRPQDRQRRAQGDALRVPRVRAVPRRAQGRDLRLGPHPAGRPALRPDPAARAASWPSTTGWSSPAPGPGSWRRASRARARQRVRREHPAAVRGGDEPVHRRRPQAHQLPLLLHPQARRS